jgi:hypothetical protein
MGNFNVLWQADASAATLAALALAATPPLVLNVTGPETLSVRRVAQQLGQLLGKPAILEGAEAADSLLGNAQLASQWFGYPRVGPGQMLQWIADWVRRGGESLNKPTHFEVRDGNF